MTNANTLAGVVQWLAADDTIADLANVFGVELPELWVAQMPTKAIVVAQSGRVPGLGDNSYAKIGRPRFDVKCYGETPMEALRVYYQVEALMKDLRRTTVTLPDGTGVVLANATYSAGPINLRDAAGQWPIALGTWGIAAHETYAELPEVVVPSVGGFSSGFSDGFEGGTEPV